MLSPLKASAIYWEVPLSPNKAIHRAGFGLAGPAWEMSV